MCATEQVPVSWLLLPFPYCNPIPMLLCVCVCVWLGYFGAFVCLHIVWFQHVCVSMDVNAHTGELCTYTYRRTQVCYFMCVWSKRRPTMPRWQTHQVEVKGLCSCSTARAPRLFLPQQLRARMHPPTVALYSSYRWAEGGGLGVNLTPRGMFSTTDVCSSKKRHLVDGEH